MAQIMEASISFPSPTPPLVLIVDDEESYRDALSSGLGAEGFLVATAADAASAMEQFRSLSPDIVLLDVMLPDRPGTEVCREIRSISEVPVIMVSARDGEIDVVLGLELGATDYVAKPYRLRELIARIRTVLRRQGADAADDEVVENGPVRMDSSRRDTWVRGEKVDLSRKEFDLLWLLVTSAGRVVTRDTCIDTLWWGQDLLDTRTLDTHIKRLRRKIEVDPAEPFHLLTIRGVGFRFDA
jgi:two-component system response regulator RegX3